MSKTMELNPERETDVARIKADLGISDNQICKLTPEKDCPAKSVASIFEQ